LVCFQEGIAVAEIDHSRIAQIRLSMPVMNHKRQDIFGAISKGEYVVGGVGDGRKWKFGQVTFFKIISFTLVFIIKNLRRFSYSV
jgi:hypothetical protein